MKKAPDGTDRHVGSRVRMRRLQLGIGQEKLAGALVITFQQVQKYEKGTNRISSSRLQQIAGRLGITIEHLFSGLDAGSAPAADGIASEPPADLMSRDGLKLLVAYHAIPVPEVRRRVLNLVSALAADGQLR